MDLVLKRKQANDEATIGDLWANGNYFCQTLEDPVRDLGPDGSGKVYGKTAIPAGRYKVIIDFSQKFQKQMIHVLDVPFFTGIRIHSGNTPEDTLGCILVGGFVDSPSRVHGGSILLPKLQTLIKMDADRGVETWIEVQDTFKEA